MKQKIITTFGSGKVSRESNEYREAYDLGKLLAENNYTICNGGYFGIMEATAAGAKSEGGKTIGVLVKSFGSKPNSFIDEVILTESLLERLSKLINLGDGYIVFPGASGTLVELATVWEFMVKGLMDIKPVIVIGDFWENVIDTINSRLIKEGNKQFTHIIRTVSNFNECIKILNKHFSSIR